MSNSNNRVLLYLSVWLIRFTGIILAVACYVVSETVLKNTPASSIVAMMGGAVFYKMMQMSIKSGQSIPPPEPSNPDNALDITENDLPRRRSRHSRSEFRR